MECISSPDAVGKFVIKRKLKAVIDDRQANNYNLEWINVLDPKKTEIEKLSTLATDQQATERHQIDTWLDQLVEALYPELKLQANMTVEGLNNLPAESGIKVYRGDWKAKVGSIYQEGKTIVSHTFASYTKKRGTAEGFASQYDNTYTSHPVLIVLSLSGKAGKDVSGLSQYEGEKEVLLMPGASITLQKPKWEKIRGKDVEVFDAIEV